MRTALVVVIPAMSFVLTACELYFGRNSPVRPNDQIPGDTDAGIPPDGNRVDGGTGMQPPPPDRVQTLADGLASPTKLVLDGDYLYWVNTATSSYGSVMRIATTGGRPQILAVDQTFPVGLVVDATDVYWTNTGIGAATGR